MKEQETIIKLCGAIGINKQAIKLLSSLILSQPEPHIRDMRVSKIEPPSDHIQGRTNI